MTFSEAESDKLKSVRSANFQESGNFYLDLGDGRVLKNRVPTKSLKGVLLDSHGR